MPEESTASEKEAQQEAQAEGQSQGTGAGEQQQALSSPPDEARIRRLAREEATRIAQSQSAKSENRINRRIQQQLAALAGTQKVLGLTDEQAAAARQKIIADAYAIPEEGGAQEDGRLQGQQAEPQLHPAVARAYGIMEKRGVAIEENDPEFGDLIKPILEQGPGLDEDDLAFATEQAITQKRDRLASQKSKAKVRSPSGGQQKPSEANDISNITDSATLYAMGEKKLRGNR